MGIVDSCPATAATSDAVGGQIPENGMPENRHVRLTPLRSGTAADSARAGQLVAEMRRALTRYQDVHVAESDGFRMTLRGVKLPVYHFTSWRRAIEAMVRFDPAQPTSLLYQQGPDGRFQLVGAMYTARASASDDDLDALVPLSVARWHEHVNLCVPPPGADSRWQERHAGHLVFGPQSPIATRAGCDSVGGRFQQRVHDWSVHVYAFAGDDPKAIWCVDHHHEMTGGL